MFFLRGSFSTTRSALCRPRVVVFERKTEKLLFLDLCFLLFILPPAHMDIPSPSFLKKGYSDVLFLGQFVCFLLATAGSFMPPMLFRRLALLPNWLRKIGSALGAGGGVDPQKVLFSPLVLQFPLERQGGWCFRVFFFFEFDQFAVLNDCFFLGELELGKENYSVSCFFIFHFWFWYCSRVGGELAL